MYIALLINKGYEQNAQTKGKYARETEIALLNRLTKYKVNHLLFLRNFNVATTITFQNEIA